MRRHLADRILTSKTLFEGEPKQVTVLFADMRGLDGAGVRSRRGTRADRSRPGAQDGVLRSALHAKLIARDLKTA